VLLRFRTDRLAKTAAKSSAKGKFPQQDKDGEK